MEHTFTLLNKCSLNKWTAQDPQLKSYSATGNQLPGALLIFAKLNFNVKCHIHSIAHNNTTEKWKKKMFTLENIAMGQQDGSQGKGACSQDWCPEFDPQNPHSRRRTDSKKLPLMPTPMQWYTCMCVCMHTHEINKCNFKWKCRWWVPGLGHGST